MSDHGESKPSKKFLEMIPKIDPLTDALSARDLSAALAVASCEIERLRDERDTLRARVTRLEAALRVYATPSNWEYRRAEGERGDLQIDGYLFDPKAYFANSEEDEPLPYHIAEKALKHE